MGKLVDKLSRINKAATPRMGFGSAMTQKQASIAIIAALDKVDKDTAKAAVQAGADAIVITKPNGAKGKTPISQTLGVDVPCGGDMSDGQTGDVATWDFALIGKATTVEEATSGENVDKILWLAQPPSLELQQSLEGLPIDAIALDARSPAKPLTLEGLAGFHRVGHSTRKPVLACVPLGISSTMLVALRDAGIAAVIVEVPFPADAKKVETLRQTILDLPPKKQKKTEARASVPFGLMQGQQHSPAPEKEGDEE